MTPAGSPRLAVAILERLLPGSEPLTGDLLEASSAHSAAWLWRQVLLAIVVQIGARVWDHKRAIAEAAAVGTALLMLLGFYAVVGAGLLHRLLVMGDVPSTLLGTPGAWARTVAILMSIVAAFGVGRATARFHRTHRVAAVAAFSASALAAAFMNQYVLGSGAAPPSGFMPTDAPMLIAQSMLFIGGLFAGVASGSSNRSNAAAVGQSQLRLR